MKQIIDHFSILGIESKVIELQSNKKNYKILFFVIFTEAKFNSRYLIERLKKLIKKIFYKFKTYLHENQRC